VRAFGDAGFDLIEQQPDRLREVTGIGPKRAARINLPMIYGDYLDMH
jgi:exodeoxyribonuclease V alpha subunit